MEDRLFYVLAGVCLITHIIRSVYEVLKHKKMLTPNRLTFAIIFVNMALLWTSWFILCGLDPRRINLAGLARYSGIGLCGLGLIVFLTALFTIKTLESYNGGLITTGIYSKIRHPMYLGFILWLIGGPVIFGGVFSSILALAFIANILFWRHLEEKELEKRFPDYADYRKTTIF